MQSVKEILSMLNESDKNEIENMLVGIGTPAVPELVEQLHSLYFTGSCFHTDSAQFHCL